MPVLLVSFLLFPKKLSSNVSNNNFNSLLNIFLFICSFIYEAYTSFSFFNNFFSLPVQIGFTIEIIICK